MKYYFAHAGLDDAAKVARLVMALTKEIEETTDKPHFDLSLDEVTQVCADLLAEEAYRVILAYKKRTDKKDKAIAVATLSETHALYAGGKLGVLQEFYVAPEYRGKNLGAELLAEIRALASDHGCVALELCTQPLPEFSRALDFYQRQGLGTL